jgi:signal transduction histidine kinase
MKRGGGFAPAVWWQKRRLFIFSVLGVFMILSVDLLAILSFDSLPRDLAALVDSHEIYVIFEEWYSYIGYFFSMCFFLLLLTCMCAVFLMNSWENKLRLLPVLMIWCSSLGLLSCLGKVGRMLSAAKPHVFSEVADGLGQLSVLPLLLCLVYYMKRMDRIYIPFVLVSCFSSSALLFSLTWGMDSSVVLFLQNVSDFVFLICFLLGIIFSLMERRAKNIFFKSFLSVLLFAFFAVAVFHIVILLVRNGFSVMRVNASLAEFRFSLNWVRTSFLDAVVFCGTTMLIIINYLRQYHQHRLQLQTLQFRDEANLEYAQNLQRYEDSVRKIKHDISNTLNVAAMLCKNGEYSQLQDYLENMTDYIATVRTEQYCRHILTNYLLLMFEERFVALGADFRCKATLPAKLEISDADMASELNNILQNALDAISLLPEEKRWVEIILRMEKNVVRIDCRNPYIKEPKAGDNGLFHTTKEDGTKHGLGLQIIYEVAEKYGGVAVPLFAEGVFEIKVAIPVGDD